MLSLTNVAYCYKREKKKSKSKSKSKSSIFLKATVLTLEEKGDLMKIKYANTKNTLYFIKKEIVDNSIKDTVNAVIEERTDYSR